MVVVERLVLAVKRRKVSADSQQSVSSAPWPEDGIWLAAAETSVHAIDYAWIGFQQRATYPRYGTGRDGGGVMHDAGNKR